MAVNTQGRRWEVINSLWIIWAVIPSLTWVAFLWIGIKARKRQWLTWSAVYFVVLFLGLWIPAATIDTNKNQVASTFIGLLVIFGTLIGIGHALFVRHDYLLRLMALQPIKLGEQRAEVTQIQEDFGDPRAEDRVRGLFEQCTALVLEIDGEMTLAVRSQPSSVRTQYADALAARAEGERLLDGARAPHEFRQAEIPLQRALEGLRQVQRAVAAPDQAR